MDEMQMKAKKKVLEEIMSMMDCEMAEGMKRRSPKFMKVEIETSKPLMEEGKEDESEMEASMPKPDMEEEQKEDERDPMAAMESDEQEDEDLERLKEMYRRLK